MKKGRDISGQKCGQLTAFYPTPKRSFDSKVLRFRCDCENEIEHGLIYVKRVNYKGAFVYDLISELMLLVGNLDMPV